MSFRVVIPARYASTRLPGKPLVDLAGKPMIQRVAERARQSQALSVVVATDDERVREAVRGFGGDVEMTAPAHASGSDRVMEVVRRRRWGGEEIVVNVQGDEPLLPPTVVDQVARALAGADRGCGAATLCEPIRDGADLCDPNVVKVAVAGSGQALYFSRAPLPWSRQAFQDGVPDRLPSGLWRRHVGIYAYRVAALAEFVAWPPSPLEQAEALEQLRLLENGRGILVQETLAPVPGGVDTPADAERVRAVLRRGRSVRIGGPGEDRG